MRILRFDSIGGASGDMIVAALLDLGVDLQTLKRRLASLRAGRFTIVSSRAKSGGIAGTRVLVETPGSAHHGHRNLADIRRILQRARMSDRALSMSIDVFTRLARAEARVHGTSPAKIHFHEVGALDAIVDIAGACIALDMLEVDRVFVGPLPMGHGAVRMQHGVLPNPPPAVMELMKHHRVVQVDEPFELVTPTGAALLTAWSDMSARGPAESAVLQVESTGCGVGHRTLTHRPNILRATLLRAETPARNAGAARQSPDSCLVLETNIDDMTPQLTGHLVDLLVANGALDAFAMPVLMKKNRPGALVTVLCRPNDRSALLDIIFRESTTFGVREYPARRSVLARRFRTLTTPYGRVRVKVGAWKGKDVTQTPEFEDVAACARRHGVPARTVLDALRR